MSNYIKEFCFLLDKEDERYPFSLPIIKYNKKFNLDHKVTIFVGENGSGKSTLLEALAVGCGLNPEGGNKNYMFSTKDTHSELSDYIRISRGYRRPKESFFFRAESYYNVKTYMEELEIGCGKKAMHDYSHGESFLVLLKGRLRGNGLYIFDEPEVALSPQSQMAMLCKMRELEKNNSQLIIATHSPIIMSYPNSVIYNIEGNGRIKAVEYEETEHYITYKMFLDNYRRMHELLFEE